MLFIVAGALAMMWLWLIVAAYPSGARVHLILAAAVAVAIIQIVRKQRKARRNEPFETRGSRGKEPLETRRPRETEGTR